MSPKGATDEEIRGYLADHGVPQFIDKFIQAVIQKQPDNWRTLMLEMLDSLERTQNKGPKAAALLKSTASGELSGMPAHCLKDPPIKPSETQIKAKGVICNSITRSQLKLPQQMRDFHTTIAARFNWAAKKCQAQCKLIQQQCEAAGKPFFDEKFWFGQRNTMYPKGSPMDCTVTEPLKAMRACELYPKAPLFSNGISSNDIIQGAVGDCFFIGAVGALACCTAQNLKPIERLFVFSDIQWGIYGVMFCKNGSWEWVIVDDWVAVQQDASGNTWPQYASPGTEPELWPMIIEKAYAKMHYCWDSIDGGFLRQALEDLTGGNAFTLDLAKKDKKDYATNPSKFQQLVDDPLTILGCSVGWHVQDGGGAGRAGEQGAVGGLFKGHAYSVISMSTCSDGQAFVRVRNPWGNDAEWKGAYSDRSPEWNRHPLHKRELNPEVKDDGAFWMKWEDFSTIFTDIDVVKFFRYDDVAFIYYNSAPETDLVERNVFIMKVGNTFQGAITLAQDDPLTKKVHSVRKSGELKPMMLSIFRLTQLPTNFDQLQRCLGEKVNTESGAVRTLSKEMEFQPGYYAAIPRFKNAADIGYYLKLMVPSTADVAMWSWDEGPANAATVKSALENAAQVPAVGISSSHPEDGDAGIGEVTEEVATESGGLSDAIIQALGIPNRAKFDQLVMAAFNGADKRRRGALSQENAKVAFKYFVSRQPTISRNFLQAFLDTGKASVNAKEFQKMMDTILLTTYGNGT